MKYIVFVSHCILNTAAKVALFNQEEIEAEEALRLQFLQKAIEKGVQLIQLPCPEFTLYGSQRWGHVSNQFDNPFFRSHCRTLLEPILLQLQEYLAHPQEFCVLGVVGIDGSPSCGVDYTGTGHWFGSLGGRQDLPEVLATCKLSSQPGIFMEELKGCLEEARLSQLVKVTSLFAPEPEKCLNLIDGI